MSSISRARSSASAQAAAGVWATSGLPLAPWTSGAFAHLRDQLRQQQAPFEPAERRRQSQRICGDGARCCFGKGDFILVDIADGDDARQNRRIDLQRFEKGVARQPAGAPRRQIKRDGGERERIGGEAKAQLAAGDCPDQRRQKWRRRRNGEDASPHVDDQFTTGAAPADAAGEPRRRQRRLAILLRGSSAWRRARLPRPRPPPACPHASKRLRGASRRGGLRRRHDRTAW